MNFLQGVFTQKESLKNLFYFLETKYAESGYYSTSITPNTELDVQNRVGVELSVDQGKRATIDSFGISGSEKISEKKLLKLFKIGEADMALMNYFTNKNDFSDSKLRSGID